MAEDWIEEYLNPKATTPGLEFNNDSTWTPFQASETGALAAGGTPVGLDPRVLAVLRAAAALVARGWTTCPDYDCGALLYEDGSGEHATDCLYHPLVAAVREGDADG